MCAEYSMYKAPYGTKLQFYVLRMCHITLLHGIWILMYIKQFGNFIEIIAFYAFLQNLKSTYLYQGRCPNFKYVKEEV